MHDHRNDDERRPRSGRGRWVLIVFVLAGIAAMAVLWSAVPDGAEARFVCLILLGIFVGYGVVWALARAPLSRTLKQAGIWLLIGGIVTIGYSFRDEARYVLDRVRGDLVVEHGYGATDTEISFRASQNGHFLIEVAVDGVPLIMLVDTGASDVILTREDAARLGLNPETMIFNRPYNTANGVVMGAPVTLNRVTVGPVLAQSVRASVNDAAMSHSLLGMSFLNKTGGYSVRGDSLTIYTAP